MRLLPRSGPRLVELGWRLYRSGLNARSRALRELTRLRYRDPVFGLDELGDRLARIARSAGPPFLEEIVRANIEAHGAAAVAERADAALRQLRHERRSRARRHLFGATLRALAAADRAVALAVGERHVDTLTDPGSALAVAKLQLQAGAIRRPLEIIERHRHRAGPTMRARIGRLRQQAALLERGYPYPAPAPRSWTPAHDRRVLYYLSQSLPHHSSGYAIRTHWLLRHLASRDWDVTGVARFGYPNDRYDFIGKPTAASSSAIDGVPYVFSPDQRGFRALDDAAYVTRASRELTLQAERLRPRIIHSASNYLVGLAGTATARQLGLPSVYEVRGLWHLTRTAKDPYYADSDHYRMTERLEAQAARNADHVFVITQAILDLLADHGVDRNRMTLLPNAVDVDEFAPRPRDERLAAELRLDGRPVIGFVGSFAHYEGLDLLLEAAALVRRDLGDAFRILLVGDGVASDSLAAKCKDLGLGSIVIMTGRVAHDLVRDYYSLIDICAYPRTSARVCQFVSPLKPLEAMAMEKAVVASDVRALAEMIDHERTGLLHAADDVASLAGQLARLVTSPGQRADLAARARRAVIENRSWRQIIETVEIVYCDLIRNAR